MFTIAALATLFAVANAGFLHTPAVYGGLHGAYAPAYTHGIAAPIAHYAHGIAAPVVHKTIAAAPIAPVVAKVAAPVYAEPAVPQYTSYESVISHDAPVVQKTIAAPIAAPVVAKTFAAPIAAPVVAKTFAAPAVAGYGYGAYGYGLNGIYGHAAPFGLNYGYSGLNYGLASPVAHSKLIL